MAGGVVITSCASFPFLSFLGCALSLILFALLRDATESSASARRLPHSTMKAEACQDQKHEWGVFRRECGGHWRELAKDGGREMASAGKAQTPRKVG
jgi:hypothetical protein